MLPGMLNVWCLAALMELCDSGVWQPGEGDDLGEGDLSTHMFVWFFRLQVLILGEKDVKGTVH